MFRKSKSSRHNDEIRIKIANTGVYHTNMLARDAGVAIFPSAAVLGHGGSGVVFEVGMTCPQ